MSTLGALRDGWAWGQWLPLEKQPDMKLSPCCRARISGHITKHSTGDITGTCDRCHSVVFEYDVRASLVRTVVPESVSYATKQ